MNRDDIIHMARESGMELYGLGKDREKFIFILERFAALVAAAATEEANRRSNANWSLMCEKMVAAEREACAKTRAGKPRELKPVGRGMLLDEQQFCFDKGWREGAASVRAAIRARGQE